MKPSFSKEQWNQTLSGIIILCSGVGFAFFLYWFSYLKSGIGDVFSVLKPFIIGFAIAYLIAPLERRFERLLVKPLCRKKQRISLCRGLAMAITYTLIFVLILGLLAFMVPQLIQSITALISTAPGYIANLSNQYAALKAEYKIENEFLDSIFGTGQTNLTTAVDYITKKVPDILSVSQNIGNGIFNTFLGVIISIYMLFGKEMFGARIRKLACALLPRQRVNELLYWSRKSNEAFGGYVTGRILCSLIVGVICYAGMLISGMEYPLLISVLVGITDLIPFIGPLIGAVAGALILLIVNPIHALAFLVFIVIVQQVESNIISPHLLGETVGLSSFLTLLAIIVGSGLYGFWGMLISIPVFAVIYAIAQSAVAVRLKKLGLPVETAAYMGPEPPDAEGKEAKG